MNLFKRTKQKTKFPELPKAQKGKVPAARFRKHLPPELIREFQAFVFGKTKTGTKIAALDPDNESLQAYAKKQFKDSVQWFVAEKDDINCVLKDCEDTTMLKGQVEKLIKQAQQNTDRVPLLIDSLIKYALSEKASDIHIEPTRNEFAIRFRIDGELHKVFTLPKDIQQSVIARFKILANLKIDEYRRPQDGRIELDDLAGVSFRVSTIPTLYGEKLVMRVLDDSNKDLLLESLGFTPAQAGLLQKNMEKPYGLIVTSGPTGSGKTTTLYGLLNLLEKKNINISTLEDPVEYSLEGVNQVQVNPKVGLDFAGGLRSMLRQDPDVIMVGEIRDVETMGMAANAALTGHLVLTTIHTNDAPSVFTRFLEMKVEDFVVGSTVNLVIAQRLVRKICDSCAIEKDLEPNILKKIEERKDLLKGLFDHELDIETLKQKKFKAGEGCEKCLQSGYSGRIGLFEILEPTPEIHELILAHAPAEKIKQVAESQGFRDMINDGVAKVLAGQTTFDEVIRTTRNL